MKSDRGNNKQGVVAVVYDRNGNLLIHHRDDKPGIAWPGKWAFFGGVVEQGESAEQAVLRELREELTWDAPAPTRIGEYVDGTMKTMVFTVCLDVPLSKLMLREGQGMKLVTPAEAENLDFAPNHRPWIARFVTWQAQKL